MLAVYKREFRSLFWSVIGWLFIGSMLALFGLYFFVYNLSYGYPYVSYSLSAITFIVLILVPVLTMRVFAEEKKNKTDQLLLTSPVPLWKIMLGKYFALATVFIIVVGVICIAPLVLCIFGEVPLLETYISILGFTLYGLCCIAIGVFASTITENQIVSAILTFVLLFVGYMMASICSILSSNGNLFTKIIGCYDLYSPLDNFMNGTFSIRGVVYYITLIAFVLFLAIQALQKRRFTVSKNMISASVFSISSIILSFVVVVLLNVLLQKVVPTKYMEFDVTSKQIYSITKDTQEYLSKLEDDITIYVLVNKKSKDENVDKTLQKYADASKHVKVVYMDPSTQGDFISQYVDSEVNPNSLLVVCKDKSKLINYGTASYNNADSQIYQYQMDPSTYTYTPVGYDCEGQVTAAMQYVTSDNATTIYELTGHEESKLSGKFSEVFDKKFYQVNTLNLLEVDAIPENCETLFITAPSTDLSSDDLSKMESYLNAGGSVELSLDYQKIDELNNFKKLLSDQGITVSAGVIGEQETSYFYQDNFYLMPMVESTDIAGDVNGLTSIFMPYSVGFTYDETNENIVSFISTSEKAFAKSQENLKKERTDEASQKAMFEVEEGDVTGKFSLGLMSTNENNGKLVVLGSAYMLTDSTDSVVSGRNSKLFTNITNTIVPVSIETTTVVIPSKSYDVDSLSVSQRTIIIYGLLWGVLMPLAVFVFGIITSLKRRKK